MEKVKLAVKRTDNYVRYSIPNGEQFSTIEYKVLLNQNENYLLRCSKVTCNGCLQLVYTVQHMQVVSGVLSGLSTAKYYLFLTEVLKIYRYVKSNGFLNEEHLELDVDRMYLSLEPLHVSILYLPILSEENVKNELVDGMIRSFLIRTTKTYASGNDDGIKELMMHLESDTVNLEEIETRLLDGYYEEFSIEGRNKERERLNALDKQSNFYRSIKLVTKSGCKDFVIPITKREFVIGKKASVVDGVIPGHPTISRIHCKIVSSEDTYKIVDLGSANGTLVNGSSCYPNIPVQIQNGDQIMISDMIFYFIEDK